MTLETIIRDIYQGLGEPSDLEYRDLNTQAVDTALEGWQTLVDVVNTACLALITWKFPDGRVVRFRQLEDITSFQSQALSGNVTDGSTASSILVTDFPVQNDNYYSGWVIEIGRYTYRVLQSQTNAGNTELFILSLPQEDPIDTAILSKREYLFTDATGTAFGAYPDGIGYLPGNGRPIELIEVIDMEANVLLERSSTSEPLLMQDTSLGVPSAYYKISQGLRFNMWPDESRTYTARYARAPRVLGYADPDAEPELPEQFHPAIILYGLWWGYRRAQENNSAYSTKRDLEDTLRRIRTEYDFQGDYTTHQFKYSREGV